MVVTLAASAMASLAEEALKRQVNDERMQLQYAASTAGGRGEAAANHSEALTAGHSTVLSVGL